MANHKSSIKRARQTIVRTERNRAEKSRMKTLRKNTLSAIAAGDKDAAAKASERESRRREVLRVSARNSGVLGRVAAGLIGHLLGAINGAAIARGTSFLKDRLGQDIFGPHITIVEDPFIRRGLGSRPFDGEGLACHKRNLIDKGVLTHPSGRRASFGEIVGAAAAVPIPSEVPLKDPKYWTFIGHPTLPRIDSRA